VAHPSVIEVEGRLVMAHPGGDRRAHGLPHRRGHIGDTSGTSWADELVCREAWARVTMDQFRHLALQTC
jgi:hypothetical protein